MRVLVRPRGKEFSSVVDPGSSLELRRAVRAGTARRAADVVFFAAVFSITFEQLKWRIEPAGRLRLFDVLAVVFVAVFAVERLVTGRRVFGQTEKIVAALGLLLFCAYLAGMPALHTEFSRIRFARGIGTFAIHFTLLIAGVAYL